MNDQESPFNHPERQPADQELASLDVSNSHPELQQSRPPILPYILMLLVGIFLIALLYGYAVAQLGLLNAR